MSDASRVARAAPTLTTLRRARRPYQKPSTVLAAETPWESATPAPITGIESPKVQRGGVESRRRPPPEARICSKTEFVHPSGSTQVSRGALRAAIGQQTHG